MFILFFIAWIIFNGNLTVEIAGFGVLFSFLLTLFCVKVLDYKIHKEWVMLKKIGLFIELFGVLIFEIAKSNEQLIYWIFSDKYRMEPALVKFKVDLKKEWTKAILADFITLTPATITALLENDEYTVHCLDKELADGIENCSFVRVLKKLEEE